MRSSPTSTVFLRGMMQPEGLGEEEPPLYDQPTQPDQGQFGSGQAPGDDEVINAVGPEHGAEILNAHRDLQAAKDDLQRARLGYFGKTAAAIKASNYNLGVANILLQHIAGEPEFTDHVNQVREVVQQNPQALKPIVDNVIESAAKPGSSQGTEGQSNSEAGKAPGSDDQDTAVASNDSAPGQMSLADLMTQTGPASDPDPVEAAAMQKVRQPQANQGKARASSANNLATVQTGANRPQIPLGGAPPPPGVPANAFDQQKIKTLTVEQVAGVILGENGSGKYKVEPLSGRSTPEDLKKAKIAQAHAVINGDRQRGANRPHTADWQTTEAQRKTPEYQQALDAARAAYQEDKLGIDPTGGRIYFGNRFENDVGEHEEFLRKDRIVRGKDTHPVGTEKVFEVYGPFTVGGGKVWTHIFEDMQPIKSKKQAPPKKTGQPVPGGKTAPAQ